jgi:hypothetical protein
MQPPPPSAHLVTFWREKKVPPLQTQRHNPSNNYTKMERRKDGIFLSLDKYPTLCGLKLLGAS